MKTCNRCLKTKTLQEFSKALSCKDGFRNYCKECQSAKKKEWYEQNKEHVLAKTAVWHENNPEKVREAKQKWANSHKQYASEYKKQYVKEHKNLINAHTSARRKRVQQRTPAWSNRKDLVAFYLNCPPGYHVDHIIPLNGKNVSGLHVLNNLQYLPAVENLQKGNKHAIHA